MIYHPALLLLQSDPKLPELLKDAGFQVQTAQHVDEALANLKLPGSTFDAVVVDFSAATTIATLEVIRRVVDIPIYFFTTDHERVEIVRAQRNPERDIIVKMLATAVLGTAIDIAFWRVAPTVLGWAKAFGSGQQKRIRDAANTVSATDAKNQFAVILETAVQQGPVVITKHEAPRAVLIDVAEYEALASQPDSQLSALSQRFDALLQRMQEPGARAELQRSFDMSVDDLAQTAVDQAAGRG